ncbi:MAG: NTP transferase domain-containing protein [Bacillota bacterium]
MNASGEPLMSVASIILAAGEGKRMKSDTAKALHKACGLALAEWVIRAVEPLCAEPPILVVGHKEEQMRAYFGDRVRYVLQAQRLGTGHAVMMAREYLKAMDGYVLILAGDMPLIRTNTLRLLAESAQGRAGSVLTCKLGDPTGYGRVVRGGDGHVRRIVEHRDAGAEELLVNEVNTSVYCFDAKLLLGCLDRLKSDNAQGEYYLTDCIELLGKDGYAVAALCTDPEEGMGVNDPAQLKECERILCARINSAHIGNGAILPEPEEVYIEADVTVGSGAVLEREVLLLGRTRVGAGAIIRRGSRIEDAVIPDGETVGPFARIKGE